MLGRGREPEPAVEESPPDFHGLRPPEKPRKVVAFDISLTHCRTPGGGRTKKWLRPHGAPFRRDPSPYLLPSPISAPGLRRPRLQEVAPPPRPAPPLTHAPRLVLPRQPFPSPRCSLPRPYRRRSRAGVHLPAGCDLRDPSLPRSHLRPVGFGLRVLRRFLSRSRLGWPVPAAGDHGPRSRHPLRGCPSLRKLSMVAVASDRGLMNVADNCPTLLELDLHWCTDSSLSPISAFSNLQILKVIGCRLVKLDLIGCEGSYDGISAIGRCCLMLEELTLCDHRMDAGWIAGLSFCGNLKTLRLIHCRIIDKDPGPVEHLGSCAAIEHLHLQRCQLRDKRSLNALFFVCEAVKDIVFHDCWGLDDDIFGTASLCRMVKFLSLEGCSLLTTEGLEAVILSWMDLQSLRVVSCNRVRDSEITPALANLFSWLKELKWRPDSRSVLMESLAGTGMGKKGGRLFNWV
ncbi:unnamed protein product [Spirodela intermedia]|uniref:Uncharacterized protein n=1 Tax=Spirodela intermedia TaxID=51605 RepID=A0A7I8IED3_SPIIN|nr:unnamed protein product [Spirodela intermedia]CAA6656147.1 unnamed protein product [Spirodela intermedia]